MLGFTVLFALVFALWVFFNASTSIPVLALGLPLSLLVAALSSKFLFQRLTPDALHMRRYLSAFLYLFGFGKALLVANFNVIAIILSPRMSISPGVVKIAMGDANEDVLAAVANSITLTPGTITLDAVPGALYVHNINCNPADSKIEIKKGIVGDFEHSLRGVFQ